MAYTFHYVSNEEARAIIGGVAVVIDVVRAYTTAAWCFERGAERLILTDDLDEALALKERLPGSLAMKDSEPAPGFDLTNSPAQVRDHPAIEGRTIVQRTTHGTIGAVAAKKANALFCASFPNASATANAVRASGEDEVWFVVTGEDGAAVEDRACAEFIAALLEDPSASATPFVSQVATSNAGVRIQESADRGWPGAHIDDVALTQEVDRFDFAMRAMIVDDLLVLRRVDP